MDYMGFRGLGCRVFETWVILFPGTVLEESFNEGACITHVITAVT